GPGEVLIAVRHAGVCGTDLHIADWDPWAQGRIKPPIVVGHEFAGEIESCGDGVTELQAGQLVTAEGHIVCGHCLQCRTGNSHICKNTRLIGVYREGAFAEHIAMPATTVLPLAGVPATVAAIMTTIGTAFPAVLTSELLVCSVFVSRSAPRHSEGRGAYRVLRLDHLQVYHRVRRDRPKDVRHLAPDAPLPHRRAARSSAGDYAPVSARENRGGPRRHPRGRCGQDHPG